ncbi:hypothetical protein, partial [Streptomyces beigongshangae]|uniref:hypothetical protein n=1 Tax=Streptomyces beigongshangae TaxID=2841597 RepID=UPI001C853707
MEPTESAAPDSRLRPRWMTGVRRWGHPLLERSREFGANLGVTRSAGRPGAPGRTAGPPAAPDGRGPGRP